MASGFPFNLLTGRASKAGNSNEQTARGTQYGSLAMAQYEPAELEMSRAGIRFVGGCQVIASGIAPVAAIPTTTATLALYNGDPTKSLLIEELAFGLGSGTPTAGAILFAAVSNGAVTAPSAASNYSSQSASNGGVATRAVWGTAVTFPAGSAWKIAGGSMQLAAANVGQAERPYAVKGLLIPPGRALGLAILSGTGTSPLYIVSAQWTELALDLE